MSARWPLIATLAVLGAVLMLAVLAPHRMISPGALIPAHAVLEDDCFACHTAFRGVSAARCTVCHMPAAIGLRKVDGTPLTGGQKRPPFHQALVQGDCMACHTDHPAPALAGRTVVQFRHDLIQPARRGQCQSCHAVPADSLHRGVTGGCASCHSLTAWKPAAFDHDRYFPLRGAHALPCAACHASGDFKRYTCTSCHTHNPARILAEHREEGITGNLGNCVACHRGGGGDHEGGDGGEDD
jgi:hypothetical protein